MHTKIGNQLKARWQKMKMFSSSTHTAKMVLKIWPLVLALLKHTGLHMAEWIFKSTDLSVSLKKCVRLASKKKNFFFTNPACNHCNCTVCFMVHLQLEMYILVDYITFIGSLIKRLGLVVWLDIFMYAWETFDCYLQLLQSFHSTLICHWNGC